MAAEMKRRSASFEFVWKIENFSGIITETGLSSEVISLGGSKWKIHINLNREGEALSLFLFPDELSNSVHADFSATITSRTDRSKSVSCEIKNKSTGSDEGLGWPSFMPLSELLDPAKGFVVNDTCFVTIEVCCRWNEAGPKMQLNRN